MNRLKCTLLKPSKRSRFYRLRYTLPGEFTEREKSLGATNKDVAERRRLKFIEEYEREACGLLPPKAQREAAVADFQGLVEEYVADLHARKCGMKYVENTKRQILKPAEFCGWRTIADVRSADFIRWRSANGKSSPKTLNLYLASLNGFFAWLRETERTEANPLSRVKKVNGKRDVRRKRRALTDDEARRLLAAAPEWRRETYLLALWTGLRRDELKRLTWGDVLLDEEPPRIVPRAETTKNGKSEPVPIHAELADELRRMRGTGKRPNQRVVRMFSRMKPLKADLAKAGIEFENERGRADFHALRHTFNARMAENGVPLAFAQRAMRHSDSRLTSNQYLDPTFTAISKWLAELPGLHEDAPLPPKMPPGNVSEGHSPSSPVSQAIQPEPSQPVGNEETCHLLALPVTTLQKARPVGLEPTTYGLEIRCS
ncbi:MAG TPA: site-specific integrase, partial [Bacteroidia bacterium]|nr:site-specific integrase [Bacteroidia bacterium]